MRTLVGIAALGVVGALCTHLTWAATFTVTNTNDEGLGSLRKAIQDANNNPGADFIAFAIGSGHQIIRPSAHLPYIREGVTLDGTTQPGYAGAPLIEVSGQFLELGTDTALLEFNNAIGSIIRGLILNRGPGYGIRISDSHGSIIEGNYIGTDYLGREDRGNPQSGIGLIQSDDCRIGGTEPASRNLISGNGQDPEWSTAHGIFLLSCARATIQGNFIGTDATGSISLGNQNSGIDLLGDHCVIGGPSSAAGNVIAANGGSGISMSGRSNVVQGNIIGADVTGTTAMGNAFGGIEFGGSHNLIGGTNVEARNVVAANLTSGGTGFGEDYGGITVLGYSNVVQGNFIGVDASGSVPLGNQGPGIVVAHGGTNVIGGTLPGAGNIVSGNRHGISMVWTSENTVQGNLVGTDATGRAGVGNSYDGIRIIWVCTLFP